MLSSSNSTFKKSKKLNLQIWHSLRYKCSILLWNSNGNLTPRVWCWAPAENWTYKFNISNSIHISNSINLKNDIHISNSINFSNSIHISKSIIFSNSCRNSSSMSSMLSSSNSTFEKSKKPNLRIQHSFRYKCSIIFSNLNKKLTLWVRFWVSTRNWTCEFNIRYNISRKAKAKHSISRKAKVEKQKQT